MARSALVVTEDIVELSRWTKWLERAGFVCVACSGPRLRDRCPREHGETCFLREAVDVAVVALPPRAVPFKERRERHCTSVVPHDTTIFVDEFGIEILSDGGMEWLGPLTQKGLIEAAEKVHSRNIHPARARRASSGGPRRPRAQRASGPTG